MKKKIFGRAVSTIMAAMMCLNIFGVMPASAAEKKSQSAAVYDADKGILAYAVFGENVETKGMKVWMGDKNEPTTIMESGKSAWRLDPGAGTASRYIYIDLDDNLIDFRSDGRNYEITVEYFDKGIGSLVMEYQNLDLDKKNSNYHPRLYNTKPKTTEISETSILDFMGTNTWKTHTWLLQHPSFQDEVSNADFRVGIYSAIMDYSREDVYVASVTVKELDSRSQIEIKVDSDNLGHIFFTGETMEFDITFDSSLNPVFASKNGSYTADVKYTITDSRGVEAFSESRKVGIKPNSKTFDHLSYKPEKYDLYDLKIEIESKDKAVYSAETARCSYSWTTYGEIKNPRAGISVGSTISDKETMDGVAKLIRNAGYTYVRHNYGASLLGRMSYNGVEPNEWAAMQYMGNEFMKPFSEYGLIPIGYLGTNISVKKVPEVNVDVNSCQPTTERGLQNYINWTRWTLDLYADSLYGYGFVNEVNWQTPTAEDEHATVWGKAIIEAYKAVKPEYPDMIFMGADNGHTTEKWWSDFFKTGVYDYLDVITTHSYHQDLPGTWAEGDPYGECNIEALRRLMKEYGIEDKEVWLTEYGYPVYWQASYSEYVQACWEVMLYCAFSAPEKFDKLFLFQFFNANANFRGYRENNWGLIRNENMDTKDRCSAKANYLTQSAMNILMSDAEQIDHVTMDETICYRYKKTESDKEMFVMYKEGEGESDTVSVDLGVNEITVYDMYGNQRTLNSTDGTYTFTVDVEPFYAVGDFKNFKKVEESVVRPNATLQPAVYGEQVDVDFINKTGKDLTAKLSFWGGSQIETAETAMVEKDGSGIKFKLGQSSPKAIEPVRVTISDADGKVYFDDELFFKYFRPMTIDTSIEINETDGWAFVTTLTNTSAKDTYIGTLQLVSPADWVDRVEKKKVTVNPGETLTVKQKILDRDETVTRLTASIAFIPDGSTAAGQYSNNVFDFAYASKANNITIDGNLSEWNEGWSYLSSPDQFSPLLTFGSSQYFGPEDLWGRVAAKWDEENFYFAGEVHDDIFYAEGVTASNMWQLDDFQIGIVYGDTGSVKNKFEELSFALLDGTPTIYRHSTRFTDLEDSTKVEGAEIAIVNNGDVTYYEMKIPWSSLIPDFDKGEINVGAGSGLRWSVLLNENDGEGREGYYMLGDGIANTKNSDEFLKLFMLD